MTCTALRTKRGHVGQPCKRTASWSCNNCGALQCPRHAGLCLNCGRQCGRIYSGYADKVEGGYRSIHVPGHCHSHKGYVFEHVLVAEKALGKYLPKKSEVHHVDECKTNNSNENLVICQDSAYHKILHQRMRALQACGDANWRKCWICQHYDRPENLYFGTRVYKHGGAGSHIACRHALQLAQKIDRSLDTLRAPSNNNGSATGSPAIYDQR